jgi:hypothetical protein
MGGRAQAPARRRRWLRLAAALAAGLLVAPPLLAADPLAPEFVERLCQRRLFSLAELECRQRLAQAPSGSRAHAERTAALVRTLALAAAHAPPDRRERAWHAAREAARPLLTARPPSPWAPLVRLQDAITLVAQGELARQEHETGLITAESLGPAQQALREAASSLETLAAELNREIPLRRRAAHRGDEPTAEQLAAWQRQALEQLARAQRNQALLFPAGSEDRLALLLAARQTLQSAISSAPPGDPWRAGLELELAECERHLGNLDIAAALVEALDSQQTLATLRQRIGAERLRIALARGNAVQLAAALEQAGDMAEPVAPELRFESLLFLARQALEGRTATAPAGAPPSALAERYQAEAAELAGRLEETGGPLWGRRAGQLLTAGLPRASQNVALLSRSADSLYLKGDLPAALAAYDEAAAAARAQGDAEAAFQLAYKAALVAQEQASHAAAASRLRILARTSVSQPHAADAHLLAAWNAGQAARTEAAAAETYAELLREHLTQWPTSPTADQACLWLGQWLESRPDLLGAIEAYSGIRRDSPHFAAAMAALARCWPARLAQGAAGATATGAAPSSAAPAEAAQHAIEQFKAAIYGSEARLPTRWSPAQRTAALAAAQLIVEHDPGSASDAEALLRAALDHSPDAEAAWRAAAAAQLVVALAAQGGRADEAVRLVRDVAATGTQEVLRLLEKLAHVAASSRPALRASVARVQLAAAEALTSGGQSLDPAARAAVEQVRAAALAADGRRAEALALYERLAREHPDNAAVQRGYAALLLEASERGELERALAQWRIVAQRTPPRTPAWYEAKYSVALAQFKLGDRRGALVLLRYLLETPPGLTGSGWEAAYRELATRCQR